jgi:dTDP-4-amino-4,6-dideoxygalactose transaminase
MTEEIAQLELRRQLADLGPGLQEAIDRVLSRGQFILGEELDGFESEFAEFIGVRNAVGVASGTDALELALRALAIGPGDEVITVAHTFVATPLSIIAVGATPVFVDVSEEDGLMDLALAEAAITERTRAVMPVHLYGRSVDAAALRALTARHGLATVEDAAQAHGARSDGRRAGANGDLGCFSFYPSKNLGALGDAGAVVSDDSRLAERLMLLRNYGQDRRYHHVVEGRNSRLDELQAAVLRVKLPHLERWNDARRSIAARYLEAARSVELATIAVDLETDVVHQFVVRSADRDGLAHHLEEAGVATGIHYPIPCHRQPALGPRTARISLPVTEQLAAEVLSLPMYPELSVDEVERVCRALTAWRGG